MDCIPVSLFVYLFACSLFKHFLSNSYYIASKFVLYSEGSGFEFMPISSFVVFLCLRTSSGTGDVTCFHILTIS
jgi:hypothetical protein